MSSVALSADLWDAQRAAPIPRPLSEWVFYLPYLASIVIYFRFIEEQGRVVAPALAPAAVLACVGLLGLVRRRVAVNTRVLTLMLAWLFISAGSTLWSEADDYYGVRKIALPLLCMVPGLFRFRITVFGVLAFIVLLTIVALTFTTQTADLYNESLASTDSPYESILSVAFGLLTVWLVGSNSVFAAALAYAACILFFKRNAIVVAGFVSAIGIFLRVAVPISLKLLTRGLAFVLVLSPFAAFYLVDFYEWAARSTGLALGAESLSSGRSNIYVVITNDIWRSTLREVMLGHGAGAVEQLVSTTSLIAVNLGQAHNEYLSFLYDFGLIGLAVIGFCLWRCADTVASGLVLLFTALAMSAENLFLVTFNCLMLFFLLSAKLDQPRSAA